MRKGPLFVLLLTVFIDLLGFGIVVPLLAYYAQDFGASGRTVGAILGLYSLMQFFFSPFWGRLSDRIGRRPVLMISLAGNFAGYALFAVADSLLLLMVSRVVAGVAAASIGTAQAYVADSTTPANRAKGMGLIGAAFGVGFILGPPIGGLLAALGTRYGLQPNLLPGLFAAALSLTAFSVAFFVLKESKPAGLVPRSGPLPHFDPATWRRIAALPPLAAIYGCLALVILAFSGMEPLVTMHAADRFGFTAMDLGKFFGFMGLIVAIIQGGVIGRITRRFGEARTALFGTISLAVGLALIPPVHEARLLYGVAFLLAVGQGLCYPALTSLVSRLAPPDQIGTLLGVSSSLGSLARVLGPLLAGWLYDLRGAEGGFWGEALVVVAAAMLAVHIAARVARGLRTVAADGQPQAARV